MDGYWMAIGWRRLEIEKRKKKLPMKSDFLCAKLDKRAYMNQMSANLDVNEVDS